MNMKYIIVFISIVTGFVSVIRMLLHMSLRNMDEDVVELLHTFTVMFSPEMIQYHYTAIAN